MFDPALDGVAGWLGLATVSLAVAGVAVALPSTAPPDAGALAATIDEVTTSPHTVATSVKPDADAIRIRPAQVSLREAGVTAHGELVAGGAVWARADRLQSVLAGRSPRAVFGDRTDFQRAVAAARAASGAWRSAPETVRVRRVTWREVDVTLVG